MSSLQLGSQLDHELELICSNELCVQITSLQVVSTLSFQHRLEAYQATSRVLSSSHSVRCTEPTTASLARSFGTLREPPEVIPVASILLPFVPVTLGTESCTGRWVPTGYETESL